MRPIDADALIEKCGGWYVDECTESGFIGTLENLLATEPTIQPQSTTGQLNDGARSTARSTDLIDRQDAINAANDWYEGLICGSINGLIKRLNALPSAQPEPQWNPVSERLPSKEERKEWIDNNLDGIGYLYPCLVTRYSSINPDRTKNNPYVAKHYFDGEDFLNAGEEVCSEYIIAWMPLPEPYKPNNE